MRSRSVAAEMARQSSTRMVVVGDRYVDALLEGRGLHYQVVAEEAELVRICRETKPHVVVFDSLRFSQETVDEIRSTSMTVSLSPIFDRLNDVDLVFHRTVHLGQDWNLDRTHGPEVRAGLQYSVIREQCVAIDEASYRRSLEQQPLSIVISMGGADAGNKTLATLKAMPAEPGEPVT